MGCGASNDKSKAPLAPAEAPPVRKEKKKQKPVTKDNQLLKDENAMNRQTHKLVDDIFVESNAPLSVEDVAKRLYLACDGEAQEELSIEDVTRMTRDLFAGMGESVTPAQLEATLVKELGGDTKDIASYLKKNTHSHVDGKECEQCREREFHKQVLKEVPPLPVDFIPRDSAKVKQLKELILKDVGRYTTQEEAVEEHAESQTPKQPRRVVCMHGESGAGKTILCSSVISAPELSRRFRWKVGGKDELGGGLPTTCWLNVGTFTNAYTLLRHVDMKLGGNCDFDEEDAAAHFSETYASTDCLLIMDDVVDKYIIRDVCKLVPLSFTIVATVNSANRDRIFGSEFVLVDYMDLGSMTDDEIQRYVCETHGQGKDVAPEHVTISVQLAEACSRNFYAFSMICNSGKRTWDDLSSLIVLMEQRIEANGVEVKEAGINPLHQVLDAAFDVAFEKLPSVIQDLYLDFSIFQDEINIPCELMQHWWSKRLSESNFSFHGVLTLLLTRCFAVYMSDHTMQLHTMQRRSSRRRALLSPPACAVSQNARSLASHASSKALLNSEEYMYCNDRMLPNLALRHRDFVDSVQKSILSSSSSSSSHAHAGSAAAKLAIQVPELPATKSLKQSGAYPPDAVFWLERITEPYGRPCALSSSSRKYLLSCMVFHLLSCGDDSYSTTCADVLLHMDWLYFSVTMHSYERLLNDLVSYMIALKYQAGRSRRASVQGERQSNSLIAAPAAFPSHYESAIRMVSHSLRFSDHVKSLPDALSLALSTRLSIANIEDTKTSSLINRLLDTSLWAHAHCVFRDPVIGLSADVYDCYDVPQANGPIRLRFVGHKGSPVLGLTVGLGDEPNDVLSWDEKGNMLRWNLSLGAETRFRYKGHRESSGVSSCIQGVLPLRSCLGKTDAVVSWSGTQIVLWSMLNPDEMCNFQVLQVVEAEHEELKEVSLLELDSARYIFAWGRSSKKCQVWNIDATLKSSGIANEAASTDGAYTEPVDPVLVFALPADATHVLSVVKEDGTLLFFVYNEDGGKSVTLITSKGASTFGTLNPVSTRHKFPDSVGCFVKQTSGIMLLGNRSDVLLTATRAAASNKLCDTVAVWNAGDFNKPIKSMVVPTAFVAMLECPLESPQGDTEANASGFVSTERKRSNRNGAPVSRFAVIAPANQDEKVCPAHVVLLEYSQSGLKDLKAFSAPENTEVMQRVAVDFSEPLRCHISGDPKGAGQYLTLVGQGHSLCLDLSRGEFKQSVRILSTHLLQEAVRDVVPINGGQQGLCLSEPLLYLIDFTRDPLSRERELTGKSIIGLNDRMESIETLAEEIMDYLDNDKDGLLSWNEFSTLDVAVVGGDKSFYTLEVWSKFCDKGDRISAKGLHGLLSTAKCTETGSISEQWQLPVFGADSAEQFVRLRTAVVPFTAIPKCHSGAIRGCHVLPCGSVSAIRNFGADSALTYDDRGIIVLTDLNHSSQTRLRAMHESEVRQVAFDDDMKVVLTVSEESFVAQERYRLQSVVAVWRVPRYDPAEASLEAPPERCLTNKEDIMCGAFDELSCWKPNSTVIILENPFVDKATGETARFAVVSNKVPQWTLFDFKPEADKEADCVIVRHFNLADADLSHIVQLDRHYILPGHRVVLTGVANAIPIPGSNGEYGEDPTYAVRICDLDHPSLNDSRDIDVLPILGDVEEGGKAKNCHRLLNRATLWMSWILHDLLIINLAAADPYSRFVHINMSDSYSKSNVRTRNDIDMFANQSRFVCRQVWEDDSVAMNYVELPSMQQMVNLKEPLVVEPKLAYKLEYLTKDNGGLCSDPAPIQITVDDSAFVIHAGRVIAVQSITQLDRRCWFELDAKDTKEVESVIALQEVPKTFAAVDGKASAANKEEEQLNKSHPFVLKLVILCKKKQKVPGATKATKRGGQLGTKQKTKQVAVSRYSIYIVTIDSKLLDTNGLVHPDMQLLQKGYYQVYSCHAKPLSYEEQRYFESDRRELYYPLDSPASLMTCNGSGIQFWDIRAPAAPVMLSQLDLEHYFSFRNPTLTDNFCLQVHYNESSGLMDKVVVLIRNKGDFMVLRVKIS